MDANGAMGLPSLTINPASIGSGSPGTRFDRSDERLLERCGIADRDAVDDDARPAPEDAVDGMRDGRHVAPLVDSDHRIRVGRLLRKRHENRSGFHSAPEFPGGFRLQPLAQRQVETGIGCRQQVLRHEGKCCRRSGGSEPVDTIPGSVTSGRAPRCRPASARVQRLDHVDAAIAAFVVVGVNLVARMVRHDGARSRSPRRRRDPRGSFFHHRPGSAIRPFLPNRRCACNRSALLRGPRAGFGPGRAG